LPRAKRIFDLASIFILSLSLLSSFSVSYEFFNSSQTSQIVIAQTDESNGQPSDSFSLSVSSGPETSIDSAVDGNGNEVSNYDYISSYDITFTFSATDDVGIVGFECKLDEGEFQSCTSPKNYHGFSDGSHEFQVRAVDTNNNVDASPAVFHWSSGNGVHFVTIESPSPLDNPFPCEPLEVSGTASTNFDTVELFVNEESIGTVNVIDGEWEFPNVDLPEGDNTLHAVATDTDEECEEDCELTSAPIEITIVCSFVTIESPDPDDGPFACESLTFSGTASTNFDDVELFEENGEEDVPLGTGEINEDGTWTIPGINLSEGEHTIYVVASQDDCGGDDCEITSSPIEIIIECEDPVTIDPPEGGTTIDCEEDLTITGDIDPEAGFVSVEIFVDGESAGFAVINEDGDGWSFEVPADLLTEGDHTIIAEASTGGGEPFTPESDPLFITVECPPDDGGDDGNGGGGNGGGGNGGGGNGGGGGDGAGGGGGGAAGSTVTNVQRTIFRVPYTDIECVQSVVELREDLIPTTDFPAVVEEVKSQHNLTVLNVWNVPDYKAMLLAEGDEEKLTEDTRFLPAETTCGEIILEAILPANIQVLAQDVISQYHVKVIEIIDMPEYKAIVILAEPDNPITKDPRFVNYHEDYQLSENYTGSGELNLKYGHIAAPPTVIEEEITPDSIKRTFSAEELDEDSQSGDGDELEVDVDIAILDTGIDLDHPDLNVYKDFSVIDMNGTGDDDQGHGTHVAGVAAAKDNGIGVVGGAPGARLWSVKVCDNEGRCKISDMIKGVQYVTEHADEIDVANISVETPLSPALNRAISAATKAGVTFVVAAGNYGQDASTTSPASSPDAITVSAIADSDGKCGGVGPAPDLANTTDDGFAPFSNFGTSVSIAAPGVSVLSTYLNGEYAVDSGTSMAAPSVTAAAALIKANSTDITPKEIKEQILAAGSTPTTQCEGGPQGYFSGDPDATREPLLFRK
jgi:hypothetical protein